MSPENYTKVLCMNVSRLFREERERQDLSLTRLSEKAGLSRQTIGFLEQRKRIPTLETMARIAAALDVELSDLIREAEKQKE